MYTFRQTNYEQWLKDFAALLNISLRDHSLSAPSSLGEGYLQACNINPHLSYVVMDLQLADDMILSRMDGGEKGFVLCFTHSEVRPTIEDVTGEEKHTFRRAAASDIFLSDSNDSFEVHMTAGSRVKRLMIFYDDTIVHKYLPTPIRLQLESFVQRNISQPYSHFNDLSYRESLKKVFGFNENDPLDMIKRQAHVIQLTEKFLYSFLRSERNDTTCPAIKQTDIESIHHIEQILSKPSLEGFPSLESLAQEVFMSPSKLKKIFKQAHGHTLYDYYNKNRLQRAKEMIQTGRFSIKQAGREIGFSNLSHFAKAFRKEFGLLPNEILKAR